MKCKRLECGASSIADLIHTKDDAAMERIAHCYTDYLLHVGRCACRDQARAQDAVQDALLSAIERLDQFRGDGTVKAWLSRMVVNACKDQERGRKNDPSWNQPLNDQNDQNETDRPTPRELAERTQLVGRLTAALSTLDASDRELFLLSQVGENSAPELASVLGTSAAAVRARLTRLRRRLRPLLDDVWQDWSGV